HNLPVKQPPLSDKCWLHREQPVPNQPYVIISQTAIQQIDAHSSSNLRSELGGALLGKAYRYEDKTFVEIRATLPAVSPDHGPIHFTFGADTWSQLQRDRAEQYPDLDIIGWFHTHPALGVFYSSDDVVVHSAAFTLPWHVGLVVDPVSKEIGLFGWINGQLAPFSGCYELLDQFSDPVIPWRVVRTAVWYDDSHEFGTEPNSGVYMPGNQLPSLLGISPRFGLLVGAFGVLLSFILLLGWIVPLSTQVGQLENVVLTMSNPALAASNAAACPDSRLRILSPLTGTSVNVGDTITILGSANYPDAARYQLEIRPAGVESWALLSTKRWNANLGQLGQWDTTNYQAGSYELRLKAVDRNNVRLNESEMCQISLDLRP
ncbi:MAG: Mov34/MPN/PAD-1 family protein, partial [Anaerolineales bacterium]|nr:Mov34/MPN/PAD-1 family protein [Anaerolineales bacterium]